MNKLVAIVISVVLTVAVLALYLVPMLFQRPPPPPPLEELVPQLKIEEGGKKVVIAESLSWAEVFNLYLDERASYERIMGFIPSDRAVLLYLYAEYNKLKVNYSDPCPVIIEKYGQMLSGSRSILLDNNCYWLKKLFYSTEKEWYVTLALVPPLANEYASRYKNYSIYTIIHFENRSMVIEFFNVVDPSEREVFLKRYEELVKGYPKVVVLMNRMPVFWYDDYKLLEETGTPYIIVNEVTRNTVIVPPLNAYLEPYDYDELYATLYKNGVLKGVYEPFECKGGDIVCIKMLKGSLKDLLQID